MQFFKGFHSRKLPGVKNKEYICLTEAVNFYTFTLTGLPVKCYELSNPVCGIWVDEVKKLFLATDVFTDNLITKFDLKN